MPTETIGENTGDDYSGTEDTEMSSASPTTNYGTSTLDTVQFTGGVLTWTSVVKFSGLSNISSSNTVSDATAYVYELVGDDGNTVTARHLLRDWVESEATWNIYSTGNSWTTGGGLGDATDRVAAASGTFTTAAAAGYRAITGATFIQDVQDEVDGTSNVRGWHLSMTVGRLDIRTKEYGVDGQMPYLSVTHAAGGFDAILKRHNGSAWVPVDLKQYGGATWDAIVLKYNDTTWKTIDTSGA